MDEVDNAGVTYSSQDDEEACFERIEDEGEEDFYKNEDNTREARERYDLQ